MSIEEIQDYLETKANEIIQKFIGKPCNYCFARLLELALNKMFSKESSNGLITSDSRVQFNHAESDYQANTLNYDATIFIVDGTETVTITTNYTAQIEA